MNGHDLLTWLQAHPDHLALDVVLIAPNDWVTIEDGTLREADIDRFDVGDPEVICLSSYPPGPRQRPECVTSSMFGNDTRREG